MRYSGQPVSAVPVEARDLGYVPQSMALFPDRTVWQQLLFATAPTPGWPPGGSGTLHLGGLQDRLPEQLSGGQRQRVSLARALSHSPRLVLLDEPFSALDAPVRDELRRELRRLQNDAGLSTVLVTHDPEEAALLADEILVIDGGRLLQAGPRAEVFSRPASPAGGPAARHPEPHHRRGGRPGEITAGMLRIAAATGDLPAGREILWSIRPERITVGDHGGYRAEVLDVADIGTYTSITVQLDGGPELRIRTADAAGLERGDSCRLDLDPGLITLWPAGDEFRDRLPS